MPAVAKTIESCADVGDTEQDHNRRLTQSTAELCFHTDSCDVVGLLCINREQRNEYQRRHEPPSSRRAECLHLLLPLA